MRKLYVLTRRNLMLYFSDKMNIFYTLLSTLIALGLFVMFMFEQHVNGFVNYFDFNRIEVSILLLKWFLAGQLVLIMFGATFSIMSYYITDMEYNASDIPFLPVSSSLKVLSYVFAATIVSMIFTIATIFLTQIYLYFSYSTFMSIGIIIQTVATIFIGSLFSAIFAFLCASSIQTLRAYGSFQSIINTLMGFLLGMYVTIESFPALLQNLLAWNPYYSIVAILRNVLVGADFELLVRGLPIELQNEVLFSYGLIVRTWSYNWSIYQVLLYAILFSVVILVLSILRVKKKNYSR